MLYHTQGKSREHPPGIDDARRHLERATPLLLFRRSCRNAAVPQQRVDGRLAAAELAAQLHGFARTALLQYGGQKTQAGVAVENALLLEGGERVRRQHLGPFVAVIAGGVTAGEDVREAVRKAVE